MNKGEKPFKKKKLFFILAILVLINLAHSSHITHAESPSNLFAGLVGYWKFDEGSGTVAYDSNEFNNIGILENGLTWVDGKYGKALYFDGIDDYVFVSSSSSLQFSDAITVACWAKVSERTGDYQVIFSHNWNGYRSCYLLEFQPDSVTPQFAAITSDRAKRYAISKVKVQNGEWSHLVGVFDGHSVKIYVNGVLTGENSLTGTLDVINKPVAIGCHLVPGDRNWFKGIIDEVLVFNRALTSEEVKILYSEGIHLMPYVIIDKAFVSDERTDVGTTQTVGFHARWNNGSDVNNGLISIEELKFFPKSDSSETILFYDDFNDDVADNWIEHLGRWSVIDGKYFVSVGIVDNGISTVKGLNIKDCIIETKLRFTDAVGYRAGIVFRYIDNEHYYSFEIGNEYDEIDIIKYSPKNPGYGEKRTFIQLSYGNSSIVIKPNVDYILKIRIQGNMFTAYLNGQKVLSWTDDSYPSGGVGLRARRADVYFDYFTVYSINGFREENEVHDFFTNSTGWVVFNVSSSRIGKRVWSVSGVDVSGVRNYLQLVEDPVIIWDQVNVTISTEDNRMEVGKEAPITYEAVYGYDGEPFLGSVTLNDTATKGAVGKYGYKVASINDPKYGLEAFTSNEVYCIFDRIKETFNFETTYPGSIRVTVKLEYEYDGAPVEDAVVKINELAARHLENGIYEAALSSWMPYLDVDVKIERIGFESISKESIYSLGNILSETSAVAILVILVRIMGSRLNAKRAEKERRLMKLEEFVKEKGRIELEEASNVLNIDISKVKALLSELLRDKRIAGIFTSDGRGFITEEKLKEDLVQSINFLKEEIDRLNQLAKIQKRKIIEFDSVESGIWICAAIVLILLYIFIIFTFKLSTGIVFLLMFVMSSVGPILVGIIISLYKRNLRTEYENILAKIDELSKLLEQKEREQMEIFEREQKAKGLVKFVSFSGNVRWGTPEQVKKWVKIDLDIRNNFAKFKPREFEKLIAQLFQKMGYKVELTPEKADYGADIIAEKDKKRIVIEVKKWKRENHVGDLEVRSLIGSMPYFKATKAIFITTSDFTEKAREQARGAQDRGIHIELWNGYTLRRIIEKYFIEETSK